MTEHEFWIVLAVGIFIGWVYTTIRCFYKAEQHHCAKCRAIIRRNRRIEKYIA